MIIDFLKQDALDLLVREIPNNTELYTSQRSWIEEYFDKSNIPKYSIGTGIIVPDVDLSIGDASTDVENAIKLYEAFKGKLNPIQASDLRLWAFLAHGPFWEYMITRWGINKSDPEDEENKENKLVSRIGTRYFFKASKGKAFVRQGIARLYWAAHMTYDSSNQSDPYEYTKYFLTKQDTFVYSTEHALSRNKRLLLSSLKVLKSEPTLKRQQIRNYFTELNQVGGVLMLDALGQKAMEKLCWDLLNKV